MTIRKMKPTTTHALLAFLLMCSTSFAAVTNTVTVSGTAPHGAANAIKATANESVDVEDDAPAIEVVRSWAFIPGLTGDVNNNNIVDPGDKIFYTYIVHNTGNVTLKDVTVTDTHDGTNGAPVVIIPTSVTTDNSIPNTGTVNDSSDVASNIDNDWDVLGRNDFITFTSAPYTVTAGDLAALTSADGDIDGVATANGNYNPGSAPTTVSDTGSDAVPLNITPALTVSKIASSDTNVPAGTTVTYTYRVKNTGNVPITNVALNDTHKGLQNVVIPLFSSWLNNTGSTTTGTGSATVITSLAPGDEAEFTATYIVTQSDVDTLQ
jgi:uncharacterized repeat protein (TIGR01451 family)